MLTREAMKDLDRFARHFEDVNSSREFSQVWNRHSNQIVASLSQHMKPLPKVLRKAKQYLKPDLTNPKKVAEKASKVKVDGFLRWADKREGNTEVLLEQYEKQTKTAFTVSELEMVVSRLDKIAGIPKSQWTYNREAQAFTISASSLSEPLSVGLSRGEDQSIWNVYSRNLNGELTYFASVIPERNTVIAKKSQTLTIPKGQKMSTQKVSRKEFAEGWKYASKGNEVPQFQTSSAFLEGYIAYSETELEKSAADTHTTTDQPLPGRDDMVDGVHDDTTDEKEQIYKQRADKLNNEGNEDVLEQGFEQDK